MLITASNASDSGRMRRRHRRGSDCCLTGGDCTGSAAWLAFRFAFLWRSPFLSASLFEGTRLGALLIFLVGLRVAFFRGCWLWLGRTS